MEEYRIEKPSDLTGRPRYQESLAFSPHAERRLYRILAAYRFPEDAQIKCGISHCRTPHGSGYLVETSDGLETNIGNVCGAKHLGADFQQERSRYRAQEKRQRNLEVIEDFQRQALKHRERVETAITRAKNFWHFTRQLEKPKLHALKAMAKNRQERIDSDDRLFRGDALALHQSQQVAQPFGQWYREHRPTVRELGIRFPGIAAIIYPFREVLVEQLQQPMSQLMVLGKDEIERLSDRNLDQWRQQVQGAERLMKEAEEALEKASALMSVDVSLFRFLPGVYPSNDD